MIKLSKKRKITVNDVCRTCLTERGHLREIFTTKIPKMLETIASVKVSEGDGLPPNICITCFHLIAKCYNFRKKIERNERLLKSHCRYIEKDILNIALNEAQINPEKDESPNTEISTKQVAVEGQSLKETRRSSRKSKEKANQFIEALAKNETETDKFGVKIEKSVQEIQPVLHGCKGANILPTQLFVEEPPPLIPIVPNIDSVTKITVSPESNNSVDDLPDDAPPLIPIKPDSESIVTIIKQPSELKLLCPACNEEFPTIEVLKQHKLNNCQLNTLQCNICKKEFKERKKLIGHLKGHMISKDYGCKICGKRYPNPSTFKVHMRTHTGERPYKCEVCGKGFIRWAGVTGHMKTHQSIKKYQCPTCGKGFKIASNLERHKVLHSGVLPYCCSYCGRTFSQSDNLQLHIRTYHTNERPYLCNECGKGFVSSTRLNRHMWIHTGYKPYLCKQCPKAYSNSNDLKNHQRTHSGSSSENDKPYACDVCEMRFYHPCRLNKHMKTHEKPHTCSTCLRKFSSNNLLQRHMSFKHSITESNEVPFVQEVVIDLGEYEGENVA